MDWLKILGKVWERYKKYLVLSYSLLQVIYRHPDFKFLQFDVDFSVWKKVGVLRFRYVLIRTRFPVFDYFSTKIEGISWLQYNQVKSLA